MDYKCPRFNGKTRGGGRRVMIELLAGYIDFILHFDKHLDVFIRNYGFWTYLILFLIIFCETGLVVTPFLPGDSLLFVTGAFAARGSLDAGWLSLLLCVAGIAGNTVNYWVGYQLGPKVAAKKKIRWVKQEYLDRTHAFYEKYGGKTLVIARFVPIIRTFAPFVAGVGSMTYARFQAYNIIGCVAWILTFVFGGYFFGNIPVVQKNFTYVIFAIIVISLIPTVVELVRARNYRP